jgi:two-component system CheB/CheR fusion protein
LLVCFVEAPAPEVAVGGSMTPADVPRVVELERELEATKIELQNAIRSLETSSEEQMAINE